jgi:hypothetical protein
VASRIEPTHNETLVINRMMKHRYLWLTHHPVYGSPIIPVFQFSVILRGSVTPCQSLQMPHWTRNLATRAQPGHISINGLVP